MSAQSRLEVINLHHLGQEIRETYRNFVVSHVNDSCLRFVVFTGEYEWHYHPDSDELFIVLEGELFIDFEDRETVSLKPHDVITIPAGTVHRTRAMQRTINLCFEHTDANTVFID
jgi:mannose-6-phosphate isomerase-like protein (cupin superfamily)